MGYVYLNGRILSEPGGTVSIADRGFRFGDGVFETVRVEQGRPQFLDRHLARLQDGLHALHIPLDTQLLIPAITELLARNYLFQGGLRIMVSRGEGSSGYLPAGTAAPTVAMETFAIAETPVQPLRLIVSRWRRPPPSVMPSHFKLAAAGLSSTLARIEAQERGADDALMHDIDGNLCETSSANLFWCKGDTLHTPALGNGALAGITRALIMEHRAVREGVFSFKALLDADEAFLTNALRGCQPVGELLDPSRRWTRHTVAEQVNVMLAELRGA